MTEAVKHTEGVTMISSVQGLDSSETGVSLANLCDLHRRLKLGSYTTYSGFL